MFSNTLLYVTRPSNRNLARNLCRRAGEKPAAEEQVQVIDRHHEPKTIVTIHTNPCPPPGHFTNSNDSITKIIHMVLMNDILNLNVWHSFMLSQNMKLFCLLKVGLKWRPLYKHITEPGIRWYKFNIYIIKCFKLIQNFVS